MTTTSAPTITPLAGQYRIGQTDGPQLLHEFVWASNNANWELFSSTCPAVRGGSYCGDAGGESPELASTILTVNRSAGAGPHSANSIAGIYFIGEIEADGSLSSIPCGLRWINDGAPFTLAQIRIQAAGEVGTTHQHWAGPQYWQPGKGQGIAITWEHAEMAAASKPIEAMMCVVIGDFVYDAQLLPELPLLEFWYDPITQLIIPTPVDRTIDLAYEGKVIATGDTIVLLPHMQPTRAWNEGEPPWANAIMASTTISIYGVPITS